MHIEKIKLFFAYSIAFCIAMLIVMSFVTWVTIFYISIPYGLLSLFKLV